jgi:hypothetical protein
MNILIPTVVSGRDSISSTTALCRCKPLIGQLIFTLQFVPVIQIAKLIMNENKNIYEPTMSLATGLSSSSSSSSSLLSESDERVRQGVGSESSIVITDSSKASEYI